ncbi:hypothetical protein QTJ16_001016 [Diplocarpon rosae]|uniref:Hyaluronan/mRNA-binding protein domain-containing protein n=1 Tax=Diplocarpon rosae TaxID=946125 RepID=A0AAD9WHR2_9HELO|nr:hypothetical protein QTJ16_001016 [Diplocarpon rosae]PBP26606.1 hypothetical protein BUE80_DR002504 [Diplocarpon rosae]
MSAVASKNLYELLGNTHDEDSDKEPEPPVKVIDKTPARTIKRNATGEAPASKAAVATESRGGRRGGYSGNEGAFRDRNAGSANNRTKPIEDGRTDRPSRAQGSHEGRGRGRGGRGGNFDRHSRGVGGESEKQASHAWGAIEGGAELADEQAGEAIAIAESKDALAADGDAAPTDAPTDAEPEDNSISFEAYQAILAEKKAALGTGVPEARKANEGSKQDKKWAAAKALAKEEEEDFVSASAGKKVRERERKAKQTIEIDQRFVEAPERGGRGGGFRGGRGRGDGPSRGGRGEGRGRGDGRGRGGRADGPPRGGRSGGPPRGGNSASINTNDTSAFPSLGA